MATRIADNVSIDPRAEIDDDVEIGPFCVIGPKVRIGRGTRLENNVTLMGNVTIGCYNHIYPNVVIGGEPQDISYRGSDTQGRHRRPQHHPRVRDDQPRLGKGRRRHPRRRPQLPHGLLPRRPRLPIGQPHHHRQRHAAGRTRPRPRPRLAFRRRGRPPFRHHRQLQLSWPASAPCGTTCRPTCSSRAIRPGPAASTPWA